MAAANGAAGARPAAGGLTREYRGCFDCRRHADAMPMPCRRPLPSCSCRGTSPSCRGTSSSRLAACKRAACGSSIRAAAGSSGGFGSQAAAGSRAAAALVVKRRREAGRRLRCGPGRPRRGPGRPEAGRRLRRGPGRPRRGPGQRKPGSSPAGFAWQAVAAVARSGRAALSVRPRQPTLARQSSETVSAPQARGVSAGPKAQPMIRPPLTLPL